MKMEFESRKNIKSAFDGDIEEIPNIYVDNFESKDKMAYFLSHAHSDHTNGMFGKRNGHILHQNGAKIYMSEETKTILSINNWFYDSTRQYEIVETLTVGMTYSIDLPDGQTFQVTLIPVTHMIGAVMFLFKTNEKTILYTGDFIVENECQIKELTKLHDEGGNPLKIDTMYVDATFDNVDYEHFPSRSLCHREIVDEVKNWLVEDDRRVALFGNYDFGYEDIYKEIYTKIQTQLFYQNEQIVNTYRELYGDANFLTDSKDNEGIKIHVCNNMDWRDSHVICGLATDRNEKFLHIYISARRGCFYHPERNSAIYKESDQALYVCYPTHCSKSQLDFFIEYFSFNKLPVKFPRTPMQTPGPGEKTPFKEEQELRRVDEEKRENVKRRLDLQL